MKTQLLKRWINHKGGINNHRRVDVVNGNSILKTFMGKTAEKRAERYQRKIESVR